MFILNDKGKLEEKFSRVYCNRRPVWELYDLEKDPDEMNNVYHDTAYNEVLYD